MRTRMIRLVGLLAALSMLAGILAVSAGHAAPRPAPPFTLSLLNGNPLTLRDPRRPPAILLFWAPWCPTCNGEARSWEREYEKWKGKGVALIGIGLLDKRSAVVQFVRQYHLTFPNGYDGSGRIAKAFGFTVQPFWVWIGRGGSLRHASYGPSGAGELDAAIRLLARR